MKGTLYQKVWDAHVVGQLDDGRDQLFIGLHLIHEVTTPQAFAALKERGLTVAHPERTFATVDHIIPTEEQEGPLADALAEEMLRVLRANVEEAGIPFFDRASGKQGIVHVIGPELGLTQPGMTICCGDSHTATHGAFGAIAFGIGTTQVRDVLATQTIAIEALKVRRIEINGKLGPGVFSKDVALHIIRELGVHGGVGYAYEFAGSTIDAMSMEERMTLCNMSIEGGARVGYCNPDTKTVEWLRGRSYAPTGDSFEVASKWWLSLASDADAHYDAVTTFEAGGISPTVTWGLNPAQSVPVDGTIPADQDPASKEAREHMQLVSDSPMIGTKVDVAFIGSCTNGRLSDFAAAAKILEGRKVAPGVRAIAVPGSIQVAREAADAGIDALFREAGFEWRLPGCSMCLGMNPDKLIGDELCVSSSNRNFKGRQGSPDGRTLLMSPAMVAAAAVEGRVTDVRTMLTEAS
ncbi:MAG: 3-isopropylmalate/(R)-2-methylmalate dehydratase large subunit [Bradymonadia bacterium]|jgi:3-isopropylmalate/(R)-2-methylmalate dehydratase large subunit